MRIVISAAAAVLMCAATVSSAGQIDRCPAVKDDKKRLACYDDAMSKSPAEECDATKSGKFRADCINEKLQKQRP